MDKKIYLYVKTHNITGLKYFGKTISDPFSYNGSGLLWGQHIEEYGYDISTEIVGEFDDYKKCLEFALNFSLENDIVESIEWANLKLETLDGGWDHINSLSKKERTEKWHKWWNSLSEEERSEINKKKSRPGELNGMYGVKRESPFKGSVHTEESKQKISETNKNKIVVKDIDTNEIIGLVDLEHKNIKNGKWISNNTGKTRTEEFKKKRSEEWKSRGIKPPSTKGLLWWNDGKKTVRSKERPSENFKRGRLENR
jgi:hypothetical protein